MATIISFMKKIWDLLASFCKKIINWAKEKIEQIKNKFSNE